MTVNDLVRKGNFTRCLVYLFRVQSSVFPRFIIFITILAGGFDSRHS